MRSPYATPVSPDFGRSRPKGFRIITQGGDGAFFSRWRQALAFFDYERLSWSLQHTKETSDEANTRTSDAHARKDTGFGNAYISATRTFPRFALRHCGRCRRDTRCRLWAFQEQVRALRRDVRIFNTSCGSFPGGVARQSGRSIGLAQIRTDTVTW